MARTCWKLEVVEAQARGALPPPMLLRREGGPEGGSAADDCRDMAAGVAAADVETEATAETASGAPLLASGWAPAPGTKNAGGRAAAAPLAANAPAHEFQPVGPGSK